MPTNAELAAKVTALEDELTLERDARAELEATGEEIRDATRATVLEEVEELNAGDAGTRVARTGVQALGGTTVGLVLGYALGFLPWDMAPTDPNSTSVPDAVVVALAGVLTVVAAAVMNLRRR